MKKTLFLLLFSLQGFLGRASAQDITTKIALTFQEESVEIKAGEVCEIINMFGLVVINSSSNSPFANSEPYGCISGSGQPRSLGQNFPIAGPIWIHLKDGAVISYRMRSNTSTTTSIPANSVVIPADASGSVQIILESSTDLVNWTQANPGTYGASTAKRFFRIRAVNQ